MAAPRFWYVVSCPSCQKLTLSARTPQAAARRAFRVWIKLGELKRQPRTTDDGGFENVEIELL